MFRMYRSNEKGRRLEELHSACTRARHQECIRHRSNSKASRMLSLGVFVILEPRKEFVFAR